MDNSGPFRNPTLNEFLGQDFTRLVQSRSATGDNVPILLRRLANGVASGGQIVGVAPGRFDDADWPMVERFIAFVNAGGLSAPVANEGD